jgi:signal recognition particle GTPase
MSRTALTRTNLLLEVGKIRRLRKALQSRSNSEAVRRVIDERLAVETGLETLRSLRKLGGLEDVFERAPAKKR